MNLTCDALPSSNISFENSVGFDIDEDRNSGNLDYEFVEDLSNFVRFECKFVKELLFFYSANKITRKFLNNQLSMKNYSISA